MSSPGRSVTLPAKALRPPPRRRAPATAGPVAVRPDWRGRRLFDVVAAAAMLALSLPLLVAVAVAVRASSPGPVLFRQRRVGLGGRPFHILKFRSMHADAEDRLRADARLHEAYLDQDHKLPGDADPRTTSVGRVLRRLSLDELPQLLNVLGGTMSLVGPRPVVPDELACYGELVAAYTGVRPGMTGAWQVSGRSEVPFPDRARIDAAYARSRSPGVDLAILARTPLAVLSHRGAR